jgi:hypothetical protein
MKENPVVIDWKIRNHGAVLDIKNEEMRMRTDI